MRSSLSSAAALRWGAVIQYSITTVIESFLLFSVEGASSSVTQFCLLWTLPQ